MTLRLSLLLFLAARSWACSCSGNWPSVKQMWKDAPAVFLGTVEMADPDGDASQLVFQQQSVRIRVDEAFKGVFPGQTIRLQQGADDCSAKFRTGQRAVFYLYPGQTGGNWVVPWCTSAIGSADPGGDDLLFLHGLPKSAVGTRLSGTVELYKESPTEAFRRVGGVANVRVKISGPNRFTRVAVTNADGVYELYGLAPGRYSVSIGVPSGLRIKFPIVTGASPVRGSEMTVDLGPDGGVSVGFVLQADTRASGRILDASASPRKDICIDLEPVEGRGSIGFDCSKNDGGYKIEMMPPGSYYLVAHDEVHWNGLKSKSTLYYPGVRDRRQATIVSVEAGKYVRGLDIKLPADEKRYKLAGRFEFADGAPVPNAAVTFRSEQSGYSETASTGRDGTFALSVVAGMEGQLDGQLGILEPLLRSCPEFRVEPRRSGLFRFMDANPISLTADSDHKNVKLPLSSKSCPAWPPGRH